MLVSTRAKMTLSLAVVLSVVGAMAWAQNLEVKGSAWFATGGSGNAGIGTRNPLGKLHVLGLGGFGEENADGTSSLGGVPILAQSDSTAIGILNASGRAVFAIDVENNGGTSQSRGEVSLSENSTGYWSRSLVLGAGNVGIGSSPSEYYKLDVRGGIRTNDSLYTEGISGWYNTTFGGGWFMSDYDWMRTYGSRGVWTDTGLLGSNGGLTVGYGEAGPAAGGAIVAGSVGIGTSSPAFKLDVKGAIAAGNSDIYFTAAAHDHTGIGNAPGWAAIENSSNYGTLMILGRAGTSVGRKVDVWDYLQVNGRLRATEGVLLYRLSDKCALHFTGYNASLTTRPLVLEATCRYCSQAGNYPTECFQFADAPNEIVGRVVDP